MNAVFGLSSPDSPFYMIKLSVDRRASDAKRKFQQSIHEELLRKIDLGKIHSEEDLLGFLASYSLELTKKNKHSKCFRHTSTKQKYFFRGVLYSEGFDFSDAYDCCMQRKKRLSRYEPSGEYRRQIQVPGYEEWLALRKFSSAQLSSPTPIPTLTAESEFANTESHEETCESPDYAINDEHELSGEDYEQSEDDDYDFSP